jgi:hypothetical protein
MFYSCQKIVKVRFSCGIEEYLAQLIYVLAPLSSRKMTGQKVRIRNVLRPLAPAYSWQATLNVACYEGRPIPPTLVPDYCNVFSVACPSPLDPPHPPPPPSPAIRDFFSRSSPLTHHTHFNAM